MLCFCCMEASGEQAGFDSIVEYLRQTRGFDFTAYKPTSLMRRVKKRMQAVQLEEFDAYLDYLQVHPEEFAALFNTILINVTSFFRDAEVWDALATTVVPELIASPRLLRVWSAGCASGQEAYSVAIMLAETMGVEAVRDRVKIYATDVDQEALAESRRAIYNAKQLEGLSPDVVARYFDRSGELFTLNRELRRSVIFGRHDLIQDAPISRVDLLLCRNTLMYFNSEAQSRVMARFYFSVKAGGFVVLGRAEMLFHHPAMFNPVDLKRRIFKTIPKVHHRDRLLVIAQSGREDLVPPYPNHGRLRELAFDTTTEA